MAQHKQSPSIRQVWWVSNEALEISDPDTVEHPAIVMRVTDSTVLILSGSSTAYPFQGMEMAVLTTADFELGSVVRPLTKRQTYFAVNKEYGVDFDRLDVFRECVGDLTTAAWTRVLDARARGARS